MRVHRNGKFEGFVAGRSIAQAEAYFDKWYGQEVIRWLEQFRYVKKEQLELLTTVDMAMEDLRAAGKSVDLDGVKAVIESHPEWQPKLARDLFSDQAILEAIAEAERLFNGRPRA